MNQALTPKALTLACALAMTAIASAQAADVQKDEAEKKIHALDAVVVQDVADKNGETTLTSVELSILPSYTGSINDAFRSKSFVQYDANSRSGGIGAEFLPPAISIRGSRNYENSFLINGLSNNSVLNPTGLGGSAINSDPTKDNENQFPGSEPQGIMLDTDLLESLTVLSENVSAEYGNFTGGVVDAQIRDAQTDRWHVKTWVRHTRDAWAKTHFTDKQESRLEHPISQDKTQPEFTKTKVGAIVEGPLMDGKLGAIMSYEKTHSSASIYERYSTGYTQKPDDIYNPRKAKRDKETFMVRLNTDKNADFYAATSLIYSPYDGDYFMNGRKHGERTVEGGGLHWSLNTVANLSIGKWMNDLSISKNHANWDSSSNVQYTWAKDPAIDWVKPTENQGKEGMTGDRDLEQETINFKSKLELNPFTLANSEHKVRLGMEALYIKAKYDLEGYTSFQNQRSGATGKIDHSVQGDKADGILSGSQWLGERRIYDAVKTDTDYTSVAAFFEDDIAIERFSIRPGLRIEYDDVTDNVNVAPRFNIEADVLNDNRFAVNAGYNRYFGNQILSEALRVNRTPTIQTRDNLVDNWKPARTPGKVTDGTKGDLGELDTPYSDEFVLGASANILDGTIFKLQGVYRDYKDQLRTDRTKGLNNDGEAEYKGISFSIEKAFDLGVYGKHYAEFGVTHSDLKGNSTYMNDSWLEDPDAFGEYVILDGEKKHRMDLPANNFNADWVATYTHRSYFMDDRLRSTLLIRYESATDGFRRAGFEDGYTKLETVENDPIFNTDLTIDYDLIKTANSTLTVSVEALNIFDHESEFADTTNAAPLGGSANMGRQFYLGMTYAY